MKYNVALLEADIYDELNNQQVECFIKALQKIESD